MLHTLNTDILLQIINNLSLNDLNNLRQTNKKLNLIIKSCSNHIYPMGVYCVKIHNIPKIIKKYPNINLNIKTFWHPDLQLIKPYIDNIKILDLSFCNNVSNSDIECFKNIKELNLLCAYGLTKIIKFNNIKILNLSNCFNLKDINPLSYSRIDELNLSSCINIIDFSPINTMCIRKLDLSDCVQISDLRYFSNICDLDLSSCYSIRDISPLKNTHILDISDCYNVIDLRPLKSVRKLNINFCYNIKEIDHLAMIDELIFSYDTNISKISLFKYVVKRSLYKMVKKINSNIRH